MNQLTFLIDSSQPSADISLLQSLESNNRILYTGQSAINLSDSAPYLFSFVPKTDFTKLYFSKGWGDAWGILVQSNSAFEELYKHFRKFLIVKTEEGKELYFRFYDPRVLRIFLPTCDKEQLKEFFGPVKQYIAEDEDPASAIKFWLENNELKQARISVADLIKTLGETPPEALQNTEQVVKSTATKSANNKWID